MIVGRAGEGCVWWEVGGGVEARVVYLEQMPKPEHQTFCTGESGEEHDIKYNNA